MAVKVAIDLNVFPVLADATGPVSADTLATSKSADPLLVGMARQIEETSLQWLA